MAKKNKSLFQLQGRSKDTGQFVNQSNLLLLLLHDDFRVFNIFTILLVTAHHSFYLNFSHASKNVIPVCLNNVGYVSLTQNKAPL